MLSKIILKDIIMTIKNILILLLIHTYISANIDYVDIYRIKGINEVENILNKQLIKTSYWKNYLKDKNVTNGYYESLQYILTCNKDLRNISIYDVKTDKQQYKSSVIVGQNKGQKVKEGDLKTPIGSYSLTKKLTNVDPFYGPFALVTNYPNNFDKSNNKTGHGIWIHGVPLKNEPRNPYTKGCIALKNDNLTILDESIDINKSILIVSENGKTQTNIEQISSILSQLFIWKNSWEQGDFNRYISFYSKNFKNNKYKNFNSFKLYKERIFKKNEKKSIRIYNINIIPYPNEYKKIMFKVYMDEDYKTKSITFEGKKELYIELIDNKFYIIFE